MIRLARCSQAAKAGTYFRLHLSSGDNPSNPTPKTAYPLQAKWVGPALKDLGLVSYEAPTARQITRLAQGRHPQEKTRLAPAVNRKRAYYDLTIAAPKTVSLAALLEPDHPTSELVMQCHVRATEAVCGVIGKMIAPQHRNRPKIVKWVGVMFHHTHSREAEPHLHTHLVIPNVGENAAGQWRAVQVVVAGINRNRLGCTYAHELSRQLRRSGFGEEIDTLESGLPELHSLRPLARRYSTATAAVLAIQTGLQPVAPTPGKPVEIHRRSRLPVPPDREEIRARRRMADELRKPKRRAFDDPVRLRDEALRWRERLTNTEFRGFLALLDMADPFRRSREGVKPEPVPPPAKTIVREAYFRIPYGTPKTPPVVFRAVIAESAGRHSMDDLVAELKADLARKKIAKAKRKALYEADSIAIAQAYYATLNQPAKTKTATTTRTPVTTPAAGPSITTSSVETVAVAPATVLTPEVTPAITPSRGGPRR